MSSLGKGSSSDKKNDFSACAALGQSVRLANVGQRHALCDGNHEFSVRDRASERREPAGVGMGQVRTHRKSVFLRACWLPEHGADRTSRLDLVDQPTQGIAVDGVGDRIQPG